MTQPLPTDNQKLKSINEKEQWSPIYGKIMECKYIGDLHKLKYIPVSFFQCLCYSLRVIFGLQYSLTRNTEYIKEYVVLSLIKYGPHSETTSFVFSVLQSCPHIVKSNLFNSQPFHSSIGFYMLCIGMRIRAVPVGDIDLLVSWSLC